MSQCMRFPTMWYVRPAKPQISLRIRAVWSEPLLVAWVFYDCKTTDWTSFGVSKLNRRLHRLVWVYTCQNATLLEITCTGSYENACAIDPIKHTSIGNRPTRENVIFEPVHEISNNLVCATSKASDQPAHTRSLIRAFACRLSILRLLSYWLNTIWSFLA